MGGQLVDLLVQCIFDAHELFLCVLVLVHLLPFLVLDDGEPDLVLLLFLRELQVGFVDDNLHLLLDPSLGLVHQLLLLGSEILLELQIVLL